MVKTTVDLPEEVKAALERKAAAEGRPEAELIREALRRFVVEGRAPRPRVPLVRRGLGDPEAAERAEELLAGFGGR